MTAVGKLRRTGVVASLGERLRRLRDALFRPSRPVLPLYQPQRSGWAIVGRRAGLLAGVIFLAILYGLIVSILPPQLLMPAAAPLVVLALLVVWALPEAGSVPTKALASCFTVFVIATILWPNYLSVAVGGLPWISFRRLLGVITSGLFLICYSMSRDFRRQISDILKASPLPARFMLGFLLVQAISTAVSISPGETIGRFIAISLTITPFFFLTMWVVGTGTRPVDWWLKLVVGCVIFLCFLGLAEFRAEHILWLNHIPSFLQINDERIAKFFVPQFRGHYRVMTVFSTPLSWGELIALATPFVLHLMANAKSLKRVVIWAVVDVLLVISAYLTGARLGMVGVVVAHATYLLYWAIRRWRLDRTGITGVATTMMYPALMFVVAAGILFVPALHNRVLGGGEAQLSNDGRREQLQLGIPAIARRPLFGYGPGEGAGAVGWHSEDGFLSIDSGFLSTAADYGVLGFVAFFGTIVLLIYQLTSVGMRLTTSRYPLHFALAASFVVLITTRLVLSQIDNDNFVFMMFGLAFALLYRSRTAAG